MLLTIEELKNTTHATYLSGKLVETIKFGHELVEKAMLQQDRISIRYGYMYLAISYHALADLKNAFHYTFLYDEYCQQNKEDLSDQEKENLYLLLFFLYEYNENWEKARETIILNMDLAKKLYATDMMSNCFCNLSKVAIAEQKYNEAHEYALQGLDLALSKHADIPQLTFQALCNLVEASLKLNLVNDATKYLSTLSACLDDSNSIKWQILYYQYVGEFYYLKGQFEVSYKAATTCKELTSKAGNLAAKIRIISLLIELCERLNHFEDGYYYYKEYVDILHELKRAAIYKTTLQLEIQHRVAAIQERSNLDGLTNIYNRYHLENVAKKWLLEAANEKSNVTCLVFDIDKFKSINDQYGHLIGDDVIKLVANTCKELSNLETTFAARFGGDEFVILLRHLTSTEVMEFANTLNHTLAAMKIPIEDSILTFTVSMGMATNLKGEVNSFHEIFKNADIALYNAKENGRNQIRQYE
ncbi:GGDEF domain-containing protein [Viridibacillus arvi]|uniref:GGDEF domain-containing protein n=1 Tax=Viridibacillus arvi TaxID=263475 RepID=UPI0006A99235|nr:GGDEF domain-containing protein [Viridibacillus arvi]